MSPRAEVRMSALKTLRYDSTMATTKVRQTVDRYRLTLWNWRGITKQLATHHYIIMVCRQLLCYSSPQCQAVAIDGLSDFRCCHRAVMVVLWKHYLG